MNYPEDILQTVLPDKARSIDLQHRASTEMNSVPEIIDEIERKIKQLEIENEAIKRDGKSKRLDEIWLNWLITEKKNQD